MGYCSIQKIATKLIFLIQNFDSDLIPIIETITANTHARADIRQIICED